MSTAGSRPETERAAARYEAPATGERGPESAKAAPPRRVRIVRWRGLVPLAIGTALLAAGYASFVDRIARHTLEDAGSDALGTELDVAALTIHTFQGTLELRGVAIADPFAPERNLLEARRVSVALDPAALVRHSVVVRSLSVDGVRVGTRRATRATIPGRPGFAQNAAAAVRRFRAGVDVPLLHLAPLDSVKAIVVDPSRLSAVRAGAAIAARGDSAERALRDGWARLAVEATLDSARALVTRLAATDPKTLGVAGARQAVADVRRTIGAVDSAKRRVEALAHQAQGTVAQLDADVRSLDDSARADYSKARALMQLPSLDAPEVGAALFGRVTLDALQPVLYWTGLAEQYAPPGLFPRPQPGPKRLRASGTTVRFVAERALPRMWLQRALVGVSVDSGPARGSYRLALSDVTSDPALVGRPTIAVLQRTVADGIGVRAVALLDRRGGRVRDSVAVDLTALPLPGVDVPGTPLRLEPGAGVSRLSLVRAGARGDELAGRWSLAADAAHWRADSARLRGANYVQGLVYRVITGVRAVSVEATIAGTVAAPRLGVRSNLDRAVAEQLRAVLGTEVARAEARLRAQVDSVVQARTAPVKSRAAELRAEGERRVAEARSRLDDARKQLDERLKALGRGALPIAIPGTD